MFEHFIEAQAHSFDRAVAELRAGEKQSHWMWYIFPQLAALGRSDTARRFGLADLEEAQAFAQHSMLGARLRSCVGLANFVEGRTAHQIFGFPDDVKFRSCLTLFLLATQEPLFREGLDKYFAGELDPLTLDLVGKPT